ncbi:MAG: histidinol-phosphatase HisJ family protein [Spirochaetota bacterium]|nr:histidinol-phosphatase HisJ family protein [Spirochaetota bacterium]
MALVDYHNHTYLCEHASGSLEDYINAAITSDLIELGFSDHAPLPLEIRDGITMHPEETEVYIALLEKNRDIYRDKIDIKLGFEIDYPLRESFNRQYLSDTRLDYLIGSCHFLGDWAFDQSRYAREFENRDIDGIYYEYYSVILDIVLSGYFNIIGHFDIIKKFGHRPKMDFRETIIGIAKMISKKDIAVEINTGGLRKPVREIYPSDDIITLFYNMNVPITLGSDSHASEEVGYMFDSAIEKIKKVGYKKISGFSKRKRYDILI